MKVPRNECNLDGYGAPLIAWTTVRELLDQGFAQITQAPGTGGPDRHTCWLATVRPDGRPHVMPVGVLFLGDAAYFNAGENTQKAKDLAHDPHCVITVATRPFDLVVEGTATRVTDQAEVERIARAFAGGGWHPTAKEGVLYADFSAPSAGPPPWHVYEVTPHTIYALGTAEPYGATRWRL
jgi:hypothetical protein